MALSKTELEQDITDNLEQWRGVTRTITLASHDEYGNQIEDELTMRQDESLDENGEIVSKENSDTGKMLDAESNSIAEAVIDNIKGTLNPVRTGAETIGSTTEILFINTQIQNIIIELHKLDTALITFASAPLTGAAALGTTITDITQNLGTITSSLAAKTSLNMYKNII